MTQPINSAYQKYILFIASAFIIGLSFLIIKPLLTPILTAGIFAYLFYPIYEYGLSLDKNKSLFTQRTAALLTILAIALIFLSPILTLLLLISLNRNTINFFLTNVAPNGITQLLAFLETLSQGENKQLFMLITPNITNITTSITHNLLGITQEIIKQIPSLLLGIFITLFITYYFIRNAKELIAFLQEIIPLPQKSMGKIIRSFNGLARGVIVSQFAIAFIQGILTTIGCWIVGLEHALLIGLITFIFAVIPFMGAAIVWIVVSIHLFATMPVTPLWKPLFMIIYGTLVISTIDNFIRPKILSNEAKINPAIILVGFIGGFLLFGLPGILLGPFILAMIDLAFEFLKKMNDH